MAHTLGILRRAKQDFKELSDLRGRPAADFIPFIKKRLPQVKDVEQLAESYSDFLKKNPKFMIHAPYSFIKTDQSYLKWFSFADAQPYRLQVFYPSFTHDINGKISVALVWTGVKPIYKKET